MVLTHKQLGDFKSSQFKNGDYMGFSGPGRDAPEGLLQPNYLFNSNKTGTDPFQYGFNSVTVKLNRIQT